MFRFDQVSFSSHVVSINCHFDQLSFRSNAVSINCRSTQKILLGFLKTFCDQESNNATLDLLAKIDEKQIKGWSETVNTINFTLFNQLAWNAIKNVTDRSKNTRRAAPFQQTQLRQN